jgi:Xaa-Pro aminopeptidase
MLPRLLRRTHVGARLASRAFHSSLTLRAIDMAKVDTTERLAKLRKLMKERNVDIYSTHARAAMQASKQANRILMPA